jgi:hypothetical protein
MESPKYVVRVFGKTTTGKEYNGTGFLLNEKGDVATCWHVVRDAAHIFVKLRYTQEWLYDVFDKRENDDVVILKPLVEPLDETPFATLHPDWFGRDKRGQEVDLWGYSNADNNPDSALQLKCTIGGVSNRYGLIVLVGAVNAGDSGGPIINTGGDVIGIANFKDTERDGQAMARPISRLCKLLTEKELTFGAKVGSGKLAERAFTSLNNLLKDPPVHTAAQPYRDIFEKASQQISTLHAYKRVHDLLFRVERGCYNTLLIDKRDFPHHEQAQDKISAHLSILNIFVTDAEALASLEVERREKIEMVRNQLKKAHDALHQAEQLLSPQSYNRALIIFEHLLSPQQSNFSVLLNEVARYLDMKGLVAAMQSLQGTISGANLPPITVDHFQLGVEDLDQLEKDLDQRRKEHDNWQQFDSFLRTFNSNSPELLSEIEALWEILLSYVVKACDPPEARHTMADSTSDWVDLVTEDSMADKAVLILKDLKKARKRLDLTAARRDFGSLVQHTGDSLDNMDRKLLGVCERITKVKDSLRILAENLR